MSNEKPGSPNDKNNSDNTGEELTILGNDESIMVGNVTKNELVQLEGIAGRLEVNIGSIITDYTGNNLELEVVDTVISKGGLEVEVFLQGKPNPQPGPKGQNPLRFRLNIIISPELPAKEGESSIKG